MNQEILPAPLRIWEHCEALARCSEEEGALTRVFLSREQRAAMELVSGWMRVAGMSVRTDAIGNVVGRYEGATPGLPCLLLGSHLDTVRDAGKYDGVLGVATAIECVHTLNKRGQRLPFAVEVIGFAEEEGVRFGATLLGSRGTAGTFDVALLDKTDRHGVTMREALAVFGLDPAMIPCAARRPQELLAYAELHIEQGPVLEAEGLPVGVVTAINGANRFSVEVVGMAGHAGTVPMGLRKDALNAAAECALAIEERCRREPELVGTVGQLEVFPGAANVIPGTVRFSLDVRAPQDAQRITAVNDIKRMMETICARRGTHVVITQTHGAQTSACSPWMMEQLGEAIAAEGLRVCALPSGAGHDGMAMADLTDIGMMFVRCKEGISHSPAEAVSVEDVDVAARVWLRFIENFRALEGS
jgi:allantoate deiminase